MTDAAQVDELDASINAELEVVEPDQPVEAEGEEAKAESAPAQEEVVDDPAEPDGVQKRINKITADKYEEKRRADALQKRLEELEAAQTQTATQSQTAEPKPEDFDYDDAQYQAALVDYKIEQRLKAQEEQNRAKQAQEASVQRQQAFNAKVAEIAAKTPDYADVVGKVPELPQETLDAVLAMDNGPQVAYYLGKHLDVADEIASSSPIMAAMRLGEIRAQLANTKPVKQPSAAPEPVESLTSGGGVQKDYSEMSMEEIYSL